MDQTTPVSAKAWWKSKTIWINVFVALISIISALHDANPDSMLLAFSLSTANIGLRLLSTTPIL